MPSRSTSSAGLAQPGGVDDVQRHAFDLDRLRDPVAGGARHFGNDRHLGAGQRVQQRALADVRLAQQHHAQALAQQRSALRIGQQCMQIVSDLRQPAARIGGLQEVDLLFGEVERGLDQRAQLDQPLHQPVHRDRELAGQRARRRARRLLGAGVDQVGHRLGLRQVELVVQERPLRELAGLGQPQPERLPGLEHPAQQQLQHHRPAVPLQLEHVLAGVRMGRRKVDRDALVDRAAVAGQERPVGRVPRRQRAPEQRRDDRRQVVPGDPHHADAAAPRRGSDRSDRGKRRE